MDPPGEGGQRAGGGGSGLWPPPHFVTERQGLCLFYTTHHCKNFCLKQFQRLGPLAQLEGHMTLSLRVASANSTLGVEII